MGSTKYLCDSVTDVDLMECLLPLHDPNTTKCWLVHIFLCNTLVYRQIRRCLCNKVA